MVVPARIAAIGNAPAEDVYIVSGEVRMQPDGSAIDRGNSDSFIVVCDSEGNYHATSPERLESVGEAVTPEQWAQTLENIRQQAAQAAAAARTQQQATEAAAMRPQFALNDELPPDIPGNVETAQNNEPVGIPAPTNGAEVKSAEEPLGPEPTPEPTVLSRVPTDAKGEPMFEQAEDAATAWDALVEYSGGDVATAKEIAAVMAQEKRNEYERARKLKPKGKTPAEILASKRDIVAEQSRTQLEYERWRQMAEVERGREAAAEREREAAARREAAEQAERERAERVAQAEADRLRLERLNGVPDWRADTPEHARARGYRRSGPEVVERQGAVSAVRGKDVRVKFAKDTTADGVAAVIDVDDLQPSHVQGVRNVRHFIPEAQPKNRKDAVSKVSAQDIAWNIRPEEITGSITAYTGAPSVNARGETIQGNSRADALKWMYDNAPEQAARYNAYLVEHAADFGMDAADIEAMERPVLVNMLDVSDGEAIRLGQYVQADTESGGVERIRGRAAARKIGADMREYAERLLSSEDEDASISQLVAANGVKTLQWMNTRGYITDTQYASCFDRKGELTGNAAEDLKDVLYQGIFEGGSVEIEEMFAKLPAKVQRAILATAYRDYDSPEADSIRGEIQQAIVLYNEMMMYPQYAGAMNVESALTAVAAWSQQYAFDEASGESYLPAERFSNFALHLAAMYKGMSQRGLQKMFNNLYDTIQGVGEDTLFESVERTPHTIAEAVKKVLGIDYKPVNERNNGETGHVPVADDSEVGQRGGRGSTTDVGSRERVTGTGRAYERGAGAAAAGAGAGGVGFSEGGDPVGRSLSEREATELVGRMEAEAEVAPMVELTPENWLAQFGEDGMVDTPIGVVKMGENQFIKMYSRGRAEYFGMVYPTLYTPDVVLEEVDPKDGSERDSKYLFVKTFVEADGARIVHFESVTVKKDGMEVSISSHEIKDTAVKNKMQNDKILHLAEKLSPGSEWRLTETPSGSKRPDLVPASDGTSLSGKDSDNSADGQGKRDNIVGGQETPMSAKIKTASAEVNTEPTEAQKEAGNYKKGHVQVGTFDITIEQPQGSVRKGTDADGKQWESKMNNTYGYIRGAVGVDGDHIDVFLSNDIDGWNGRRVYVVDQYNRDGSFDEHKVMLGFNDADEAKNDYLANYEQGWENSRRIDITGVNLEDFEKWIESSKRKTKPFGEYSSVKKDVVEEKNGGSGLNGRTGNTGSNGENENNGSKAAEIAHLEELLEKPGADKKLVRAEIARLRGEGQKAAKPDEGVEQVDADLAAKLRKSPGFELSTKKVKGKVTVNPKDYAPWRKTAEDNKRPQLRGVHYEEGLAMATDTASIIMVRSKYPTAWEGKTIGWDGKALDFEHGYVPWRKLLSMRRKAAYAVDAAAFKAAVEQACADEASGEFNVSDYAIGVPYHGGKIYIALKRAELLADLLGNVKHGELRLNGTGQYLCLSGDGVYSIHMGVSKESLSYGLGTHVVDMPSGGVKQSKADGAVAEGVEASEAVLRDAVIERLREAGVEVVTDVAAGQKVLDEANEETGMSNAGQQQVRLHARLSALTKAANTIRGWLDGNKRGKVFTIELPEATQRMIRKVMGRDFDSHNITANGVVHAQKNHGVGGRKLNERSIPLTKVDMELMPYIMTAPDYVRRGSDDMSGRVSVRFYKELGNGYVVVAEKEYKNSPDDMETITMWAEMSDKATNAQREAALDTHVQNAILDIDAAKIRRDAENAIENDIKIREHRVCHGSGADFESFDHSHMGTGEGAQVFGWGTYVTEVEGIGRGYATKIVTNNSTNLSSIARQHNAKRFLKKYPTFEAFKAYVDETRPDKSDIALNYYNQNVDDAKGQRHLYTVEIPEDTGENYIDHDKGLTPSQATRVRTALEGIGVDLEDFARRGWRLDMPFEYVYNIMIPNAIRGSRYEVAGNVQRKASEFLSQLGFTGIKYPAEYTSGGRADGAKNYVIFDDKDLKITDHVRFFRTGEGEAYGFTVGGKIYIDPRIATAETPVHEYAHLWAEALRCGNAEEWSNVVGLMKDTPVWDEVRERYPELESEDEIADEVIATYSGRRGAERMRAEAKKVAEGKGSVFEKAEAISALERVKQALARFWKGVCDFLHIRYTSAEEVADRVMKDMLDGVNPREVLHKNEQNAVIQRVNPMEDDYHTGVRGVEDIRTLREAIAEARAEGEEGGWDALSSYPDVSNAMLEAALRSGRVRVYSSKPIEAGVFVTPSRMQAEDYAGGGKVYSKEVSVDDVAWLNTDEGQLADVMSKDETGMSNRLRFQYVGENGAEGLEAANARFNAELELQIDGKLPIGHVYKMGRPSEFLRAAGIPNLPIELPASQLSLKASSGKHDFDLQEVRDLPKAIANPIATFAYGDKGKSQNILTLLDHNGEKFLVGIFIRPTVKGRVLEVNSIRNVFPKNSESIVRWILDGKLTNANRKELLAFLDQQRTNLADVAFVLPAEQAKQGIQEVLETAAKVVKEFENPNVSGEKDAEAGQNENNGNAGNYENNGKNESDMRYRTSEELDSEYGRRWLDEQTNSDGRHTTQVKNTLSSYQKFGEWVKREARGREVDVLDASSGLGIGTEWMRDNGIKVEDVEPYPSERRAAPTYKSYGDIKKKYDYIISNAVLNVIPDDWRAGVLHDMADKLKDGGRMVLNVRSAESIRRQGKEGETRITLDDPSEILVLRPDGSIKAYQKGFTKTELKEWCEKELGAGYKVEIANKGNAGGSYDTAVVVTKKNESGTVGVASETGRPSRSAQAVSNSGTKVGKKSEYRDGLEEISDRLDEKAMGAHEFLYNIAKAFGLKGEGLRASFYQDLGNSVGIRVSDHSANTDNIASKNANSEVYGLVVKLGRHRFKSNADADYLEYVYYPDRLDGARQKEIVDGLKGFVDSGDYTLLPKPDRVNRSGRFEMAESGLSDENNGNNKNNGNNSDPEVMAARARELAELLNTPVRIIRTEEEVAALPSVRQRRMKGSFNPMTGEVIIVVPNNANMADIENTFVHEVVGHDGLRVLFPDEAKLNNALDELYRVSKDEIRGTIDRMAQKMYDAEVDRIREKKRKEHEANGEDATASYYADMAAAHAEAGKKREQFKRDATEEYGADLAGRIGEGGFEKMSAAEQTFWGRLKAMLQKALQRLLDGLKIRSKRQWGDKEWAFVLHEAFKRKRNGGRPTIFDMADTEVMRRKTGFGEMSNVESYGRDGKGNQKETVNLQYGKRLGQDNDEQWSRNGGRVAGEGARSVARGGGRGDIRVFEKGLASPRGEYTVRSERDRREAESERLVNVAKENGLYMPKERIRDLGQRLSKQSRESEVYISDGAGKAYKVKDPYASAAMKPGVKPEDAIYEYLVHNKYFPETAYTFEGITDDLGDVRIVLSQDLVRSTKRASARQVAEYLAQKGLKRMDGYHFGNDEVTVTDVEGDNAFIDENDKVRIIDLVIDFRKPAREILGDEPSDNGIKFRDGEVGLGEAIAQMKEAASLANADNRQAKEDAMKAIGGNLSKLRQAMARQRGYDLSTVKSITDLVKRMLENGLLDDLGKAETKRILSTAANVTGREDTSKYVQKVMDIMVDNQLRRSRDALGRLLSIRGKRVDGRGIEVQGALDANGVAVLQAFKKSKGLDWATIDERISDAFNRMSSEDDALAEEATLEYSGLVFASVKLFRRIGWICCA